MQLKQLFKGKERKSLLANFGYLSLLQVANLLFPLITLPYLAKTIGVECFGKIAFAAAVIMWVQTVTDWGFNYSATRDAVKVRDDKEKVSDIFSNVFWARVMLMVVSLAILLVLIFFIPKFKEHSSVLLVTFLLIPGYIACPEWFFQAMEKMKYITILNVLSKLIFTVLVFVCIKSKSDYILQPALTSLGYIVAGILAMIIILRQWGVRIRRPHFNQIVSCIKGSTDVFINNIIPNIYNSLSVVVLGFFGGSASTGIFDAGNKFITPGHQVVNVVSRTFYPVMSRRIDKHGVYAKICLAMSMAISVALFFSAPLLIKWFFTAEFAMAVYVLKIKAICVFFVALNRVYGINYLIVIKKEKILRNITVVCSFIGFAIMFPLVYFFDFIGAAITICVTQGLIGVVVFIKAKKEQKQYKYDN